MAINIPVSAVKAAGGQVTITDPALTNSLIQNQAQTVQLLQAHAPAGTTIHLSDISVDKNGAVVIKNAALATSLSKSLAGAAEANNGVCGVGCAKASFNVSEREQ